MAGNEPLRRRPRTPIVLQGPVTDCGVAALAIVLGHHGLGRPMTELRQLTGVGRDGITARTMLAAARHCGLEAKGWRTEPADLPTLGFPLIAHCGFNHFVVVEAMADSRVWLNDPAIGPYVSRFEDFELQYTGIALSFRAPPNPAPPRPWRSITAALPRLRLGTGLVVMALGGIAGSVASVVLAVLVGRGVDAALAGTIPQNLAATIAAVAVIQGICAYLRESGRTAWHIQLEAEALDADWCRLWQRPTAFFTYRGATMANGLLAGRAVAAKIAGPVATAALTAGALTVFLTACLMVDGATGAAALVLTTGMIALSWRRLRDRVGFCRRNAAADTTSLDLSTELMENMEAVRLGVSADEVFAECASGQAYALSAANDGAAAQAMNAGRPALVHGAAMIAALSLGAIGLTQGNLTAGAVVTLALLMHLLAQTLLELSAQTDGLRTLYLVLLRRLDLVEAATAPEIASQGVGGAGLEASAITFGYHPDSPPILAGVEVTVPPGAQIGLTGTGGCGKSTLAQMLAGLHAPWSGHIRAGSVALVDTNPILFPAPLREVVRLWDPRHGDADVMAALADVGLAGLVAERPGGLDAQVESGGTNLSGGQRLRLELARALLRRPATLIVDEVFDALDLDIEQTIRANLRRRGCALLIVSHRAATLRACDEVLLLNGGKITERGGFDHVVSRAGLEGWWRHDC